MPKLLVLFHSRTGRTAALADAIADGAKSVRFTEVDVRRLEDRRDEEGDRDGSRGRHRALADESSLADYDAIILGAPAGTEGVSPALAGLLDRLGPLGRADGLSSKVGSAFAATAEGGGDAALWSLLTSLGKLGMILVPPAGARRATDEAGELAAGREHGRRVATVVEWVAHAKSHAH